MANSGMSVGGLVSGLDTNAMLGAIMDVERRPIALLQQRRSGYQAKVDAWQSVRTRLSGLRKAIDALKTTTEVARLASASSSNETVATATVKGSPSPGSVSFTVGALAASHKLASGDFASSSALVGAGTFTVTKDGVDHTVTTTDSTTLQQLATQISGLGAGVSASVVQIDAGTARLLVTAAQTGTTNTFTASGTQAGLGAFTTVEAATDAQITIGSGAGAITLTRSSNTVDDLLPGISIALKATSASAVTVTASADVDGAVTAIRNLVDEVNKSLATLADLTKYDATSKRGGVLVGDSAALSLKGDLRRLVSDVLSGVTGTYRSAGSLGIQLTRQGSFTLDETKLRAALSADFTAATGVLARTGSATDARVAFVAAQDATLGGSYAVSITQAATKGDVTGDAYVSPASDESFTIASGSKTATIDVAAGATLDQAVSTINAALDAEGISTLRASSSGGALRLTESRYGSANAFTVAGDGSWGLDGTYDGTDVSGTVNGLAAAGSGQILLSSTGASQGLSLRVTASAAEVAAAGGTLALGTVAYSEGVAGRLSRLQSTADGAGGAVTLASSRWSSQIALVDKQVKVIESRLQIKETSLRRKFSAMETAMSGLTRTGNWLASQIASMAK